MSSHGGDKTAVTSNPQPIVTTGITGALHPVGKPRIVIHVSEHKIQCTYCPFPQLPPTSQKTASSNSSALNTSIVT